MNQRLEKAGAVLLRHVDTSADMAAHAALRARVVEALDKRRPLKRRGMFAWVAVPAALVAVAGLVVMLQRGSTPSVTFTIAGQPHPGVVGSYLTLTGDTALPLLFSDGSAITLYPGAKARVSRTSDKGADILLESGRATCRIVHRPGAAWGIVAGPYTVEVRGTSFDLGWEPASGILDVWMQEGVVRVRGPAVEAGLDVRDQQHFNSRSLARLESSSNAESSVPAVPSSISTVSDVVPRQSGARMPAAGASVVATQPGPSTDVSVPSPSDVPNAQPAPALPRETWSTLLGRGEYRRIITEAEERGIDSVLASGTDTDLSALADAARFAGRWDLSVRALQAIRSRFSGSAAAAYAAFVMGRTADDGGNAPMAIGWYDRYLAEAPGGPLVPEVMGRRMVALRKTGNHMAAQQAAEVYLKRFPRGPYAGLAHEMLPTHDQ